MEVNRLGVRRVAGSQKPAMVTNIVAVAVRDQVGSDIMAKAEKMEEKSKAENLSLQGEFVADKTAHARAFMDDTILQWNRKKAVKEKEGATRLLAAERSKQNISAVVE